jgi:two-component system chemotaxis response regulator CheB
MNQEVREARPPFRPIRVLVVDDSAFMRVTLSKRLAGEADLEVVGTARDGQEALAQVAALQPDVVTMDVQMPRLDGLGALVQIMAERPTPVIMVSSLTVQGAEITARALTLGAVDCVAKPSQVISLDGMIAELATKIRQVAGSRVRRLKAGFLSSRNALEKPLPRALSSGDHILAIGSSTGGPAALCHLFGQLPTELDAAAVVVQHMPAGFTRSLADHLDRVSGWKVKEAEPGDRLLRGQALLAPGGLHMVVNQRGEVMLTDEPPVNAVRPAADVTMRSVAEAYGERVVGVVLTGMGRDGTEGALAIRACGGQVIAEAESTCVVYGMPRSVVEAGAANYVVPLHEIAPLIHRLLKG